MNTKIAAKDNEFVAIDWDGLIYVAMYMTPPDNRKRDDDNIVAAFKSGRDGVALAMGVDDNRFRVTPFLMPPIKNASEITLVFSKTIYASANLLAIERLKKNP